MSNPEQTALQAYNEELKRQHQAILADYVSGKAYVGYVDSWKTLIQLVRDNRNILSAYETYINSIDDETFDPDSIVADSPLDKFINSIDRMRGYRAALNIGSREYARNNIEPPYTVDPEKEIIESALLKNPTEGYKLLEPFLLEND